MKMQNKRNQNIYETLANSSWFREQYDQVRKEYKRLGNSKVYLFRETKRLCRYMPTPWEASIRKFIETGVLIKPSLGTNVVYQQNNVTGVQELFIQIYRHTTQDDVKRIWSEVKRFQKMLKEVWAPALSDTNLRVLATWDEVESREKKPKIIAREVHILLLKGRPQISLGESTIRKIVSDLRKQLHAGKKSIKK
jgi:hypothetical protein